MMARATSTSLTLLLREWLRSMANASSIVTRRPSETIPFACSITTLVFKAALS